MNPYKYNVTATVTTIEVTWESSCIPQDAINCLIKYRQTGRQEFLSITTKSNEVEINGLKSNTQYDINLYWVDDDGENHRLFKETCTTEESKANYIMENAIVDKSKKPYVYQLTPRNEDEYPVFDTGHYNKAGEFDKLRVYDMIAGYERSINPSDEKTLLLVGATGTGKSTMINALINYLAEVSWSDEHRFKLILESREERRRSEKQHQSQTSSITAYRIPKIKSKYRMTIIDTPGFNDTRENFDKRITLQMKYLFEKRIEHLDAVLVVVPLSTTRLTEGQAHVFSSILEIFGKEIAKNIFVLITWDDGGDPVCLNVLKEAGIPIKNCYRFNNSNLFSEKIESDTYSAVWTARSKSFSELLQKIEDVPRTTIESSVEVMRLRTNLQLQLKGLEDEIREKAQMIINCKRDEYFLESQKGIGKSQISQYVKTVPQKIHKYTGKKSLNCTKCKKTCHKNCWVPLDIFKWTCESIVNGKCKICENECDTSHHIREKYEYQTIYEKVIADLNALDSDTQHSIDAFSRKVDKVSKIILELNTKALKKFDTEAYIQNLIRIEENERQTDYEARVKILTTIQEHFRLMTSLSELIIVFINTL